LRSSTYEKKAHMQRDKGSDANDPFTRPTGAEVLRSVSEMQDGYEALTMQLLHTGQLGVRAPRVFENLGAGLLLLTEAGSCHWGCRGGDHIVENLVRRYCNYAFGTLRLSCLGLYDEALALVRSLAELGNLLQLFHLDVGRLDAWRKADSKSKLKDFTPYQVRTAIEALGHDPNTNKDKYSRLCEMGIHVSPTTATVSHNIDSTVYFGGNFSIPGFLLVLNEMAHMAAPVLTLVGALVTAPDEKMEGLTETAQGLSESASWLSVTKYEEFFDSHRVQHEKEVAEQRLHRMDEDEFRTLSDNVMEDLIRRGDVPADSTDLSDKELEDKVYPAILGALVRQALDEAREE
jgi:hypothetical protein